MSKKVRALSAIAAELIEYAQTLNPELKIPTPETPLKLPLLSYSESLGVLKLEIKLKK